MLRIYWKLRRGRERKSVYIVLATMFFGVFGLTVALFLVRSMKMDELQGHLRAGGNYDLEFYNISESLQEELEQDELIGRLGRVYEFGNARIAGMEQSIRVGALENEAAQELFYVPPVEGHYPGKEGEICMNRLTMKECGMRGELGEKIALVLPENGKSVEREYTLSGIIELKSGTKYGDVNCSRNSVKDMAGQDLVTEEFPMAYIMPEFALDHFQVRQTHCFATLKELTDKNIHKADDRYYSIESKKWNREFKSDWGVVSPRKNAMFDLTQMIPFAMDLDTSMNHLESVVESGEGKEDFNTKFLVPGLLILMGAIMTISIYDVVRLSIEKKKETFGMLMCLGMNGWRLAAGVILEYLAYMLTAWGLGLLCGSYGFQLLLVFLEKCFGILLPSSFLVPEVLEFYMPCVETVTRSPWILPGIVLFLACGLAVGLGVYALVRMSPLDIEKSKIYKRKRKGDRGLYGILNRNIGRGPWLNRIIPWLSVMVLMSTIVFGYLFFRCKAAREYSDLEDHLEEAGMGNFDYYMNRTEDTVNLTYSLEGRHDTGVSREDYQAIAREKGVKDSYAAVINRSSALVYPKDDFKCMYLDHQKVYGGREDDLGMEEAQRARYQKAGVKAGESVVNMPTVGLESHSLHHMVKDVTAEESLCQVDGKIDEEKLASGEEVVVMVRNKQQRYAFEVGEELRLCDFILPEELDASQQAVQDQLPPKYQKKEREYSYRLDGQLQKSWNYYSRKDIHPRVGAIVLLDEYEDYVYFENYGGATVNILTVDDAFLRWGLPDRNYTRVGIMLRGQEDYRAFEAKWYQMVLGAKYMTSFSVNELVYATEKGKRNVMAIFFALAALVMVNGFLGVANGISVRVENIREEIGTLGLLGMEDLQIFAMNYLRYGKIAMVGAAVSIIPVELFSSFCKWCTRMRSAALHSQDPYALVEKYPWIHDIPYYLYDKQPVMGTAMVVWLIMLAYIFLILLWKVFVQRRGNDM